MRIGLVTCYLDNFGACLQAFAMQTLIKKCGHSCEIINYTPDTEINNPNLLFRIYKCVRRRAGSLKSKKNKYIIARKRKFDQFRKEYLQFNAAYYSSPLELEKNPPDFDAYVVGSDQLWNPIIHKESNNKAYFLSFVPDGKRRIAYAPSIGIPELPDEFAGEMAEMLRKFDVLTTREESGSEIVEKLTGRNCRTVLDPTLLIPGEEWKQLSADVDIAEPYIFCYLFGSADYIGEFVRYASELTGLKVVVIPFAEREYNSRYTKVAKAGPLDFVGLIKRASLVITDSFHATAFSISMNVPFYALLRNTSADRNNMNSRIFNILNATGLSERLIDSKESFPHEIELDMSFDAANKVIAENRIADFDYLKNALIGEIK